MPFATATRQVPYSLVTATDLAMILPADSPAAGGAPADAIVLNEWAARALGASVGNRLTIDYYLWDAAAGLQTKSADFTVSAIVPIAGAAADRRLAPEYPGITQAESVSDWDPPFPIDLSQGSSGR